MTTTRFRGDAQAVAQVSKITPANVDIGDIFIVTINRKDISFTATAATVANVAAGVVAAFNASTEAEFSEITASTGFAADGTTVTHIVLTGDTAGKPFTVTSSTSDGAGFGVTVTTSVIGDVGQNEKQILTLAGNPSGGAFTITFEGQTTGTIAYNAPATGVGSVQTALEALSNIAAGDGAVTGSASGPWTVEFKQAFAATNVAAMTTDGSSLTGGHSITIVTTTQGAGGTNEVQSISPGPVGALTWSVSWTAPDGTFDSTFFMSAADSAASVQATLEGMSNINPGDILVTQPESLVYQFEFTGRWAKQNVNSLVAENNSPTGGTPATTVVTQGSSTGIDEVQLVTLDDGPTGGTFTLTFESQTTAGIAYNASASTVQAALEALSNIAAGEVVVTGGAGGPWTITFSNGLGGSDRAEMTSSASSLSGGAVYVTTTQDSVDVTNEVQSATLTGSPTGGTFTLTYSGQTTSGIAFDASAATVEAALEALSNIASGEVAVIGSDGGPWTVTFQNGLGGTNVAEMTGSGASLTGSGSQTLVTAALTAATGPNHWYEAENWSANAVPVSGDDVYLENSSVDILYGLDQSAVTLTSLNIAQSYTGKIGLAIHNGSYYEYRETQLSISATNLNIGSGEGSGSGRVKIDTGSIQTTILVSNSGSPEDNALPAILWKGTHASNVARIFKGSFGAAIFPGEAATLATLQVGYQTDQFGDSKVECGSGCTLTTIDQSGGTLDIESAATTITQTAGELTINGSGAITTLNVRGGTCWYNSNGTLTTALVADDGVLDFTQDMRSKTVTNPIEVYGDGEVKDAFQVVSSLIIDANQTGGDLSRFQLGDNIRITRGALA